MEEEWCAIDDRYFISSAGRIMSRNKELKQATLKGFKVVNLHGVKYVHRLVAEYFLDNPSGLPQLMHLDGDKSNNHVSNLKWVDFIGSR